MHALSFPTASLPHLPNGPRRPIEMKNVGGPVRVVSAAALVVLLVRAAIHEAIPCRRTGAPPSSPGGPPDAARPQPGVPDPTGPEVGTGYEVAMVDAARPLPS